MTKREKLIHNVFCFMQRELVNNAGVFDAVTANQYYNLLASLYKRMPKITQPIARLSSQRKLF